MVPVHPGGEPEVPRGRRSQKKRKKIPEKPDFPDPDEPDPDVVLRERSGGRARATCSQNFRPLAAVVPEITSLKSRIIY